MSLDDLISNIDDQDADWQLGDDQTPEEIERVKYYWKIVANNLSKAGLKFGAWSQVSTAKIERSGLLMHTATTERDLSLVAMKR